MWFPPVGALSFDVYRDGVLLASNVPGPGYDDTAEIVANTSNIGLFPASLNHRLPSGLVTRHLTFKVPSYRVYQIWSKQRENDLSIKWLKEVVDVHDTTVTIDVDLKLTVVHRQASVGLLQVNACRSR